MIKTRIMLSVDHLLQDQLFRSILGSNADIELVGETCCVKANNVVDILLALDANEPHLWIHSWDQGPDLEAVLSHIYQRHSNLIILRVAPDELSGFAQVQIDSTATLLRFAKSSRQLLASA